jgi:hypothetical protein
MLTFAILFLRELKPKDLNSLVSQSADKSMQEVDSLRTNFPAPFEFLQALSLYLNITELLVPQPIKVVGMT